MTKLSAVNRILRAIGQPPVTALDTNGTTEQAEAENFLDEANIRVQNMGWQINRRYNQNLYLPTQSITCTGTGTFTYDETITQATSGATGRFRYETGGKVYVYNTGTAAWDASHGLTGGTSGTTRTVSATAAVTTAKHAVPTSWLWVRKADNSAAQFVNYGGYLYDTENGTTDWSDDLVVDRAELITFTDLPNSLAEYVTAEAAWHFQRYKRRGTTDDAMLQHEREEYRRAARLEDQELSRINVLNTNHAWEVRGRRNVDAPNY